MVTHSSFLACKISWTEEPGGLHPVRGVTKSRTWLSMHTQQSIERNSWKNVKGQWIPIHPGFFYWILLLQPNVLAKAELKNTRFRVIYFHPEYQGELIILNFHRGKIQIFYRDSHCGCPRNRGLEWGSYQGKSHGQAWSSRVPWSVTEQGVVCHSPDQDKAGRHLQGLV